MSKVKIYHALNGEMEVTAGNAENKLRHNHVKNGGSYCRMDEVDYYFHPAPDGDPNEIKAEPTPFFADNPLLQGIVMALPDLPEEAILEIQNVIDYHLGMDSQDPPAENDEVSQPEPPADPEHQDEAQPQNEAEAPPAAKNKAAKKGKK